jgi:hypothetical protein
LTRLHEEFSCGKSWKQDNEVAHDVFIMDIALSGGQLFIIEAGCANSAGWYKMDIDKFVTSISDYMAEN